MRDVLGVFEASAALRAALGIWLHQLVSLDAAWQAAMPLQMLGRLSGDVAVDQPALDEWAREVTGGQIDQMPVSVGEETLMVLASGLRVQTDWVTPFEWIPPGPGTGPWVAIRGATWLAAATTDLSRLCIRDSGAGALTSVRWPGRDSVDVYLFLGEESAPPGSVLSAGLEGVARWRPALDLPNGDAGPGVTVQVADSVRAEDTVWIQTVGFEVEGTHDLLTEAQLFGLGVATEPDPGGHFPGISSCPLRLDRGRQDAAAKFSAEGFTAAAVTAFAARAGGADPRLLHQSRLIEVTLDRPFGFAAIDRETRLALVAGWVEQPSVAPEDVYVSL
jgi:hypothetical protein